MSSSRDEIVEWTNDYLKLHEYKDFGPMGLQFTGTFHPGKIATAVSVSADVIEAAAEWGADMLFTHHGLWWNNESRILDKRILGRLELARKANVSILGYHLCLDAHPEIGNNILLAKRIGIEDLEPFGEIGWGGNTGGFSSDIFGSWLRVNYRNSNFFPYGPEEIERVAVIAGGAPQYLVQAAREGYDLFVTGEAAEFSYYQAKELGIHFVAAGHHRTEKAGIIALGEKLEQQFRLEHKFFDVDNPI